MLSAQTVVDGTVVTPETAMPSTRLGPGSGAATAAAAGALGRTAGGSWKATSASWIEPRGVAAPKRSSTASRSARSTPENSLSGIRRPLSTTWRRKEPSDGSSAVP